MSRDASCDCSTSLFASAAATAGHRRPAPPPATDRGAARETGAEQLSALAPANLAKPRPKPPFEVTGNWFIDVSENPEAWRFGPPYPKLTPAAQVALGRGEEVHRRRQGLSRRHRSVLAGRAAAHHDPLLADGDGADPDRHLHDQRLHEQRAHRLSGRPQAHRPRHHRPDVQRRVDRHVGRRHAGGGHDRLPWRSSLDGSGRRRDSRRRTAAHRRALPRWWAISSRSNTR